MRTSMGFRSAMQWGRTLVPCLLAATPLLLLGNGEARAAGAIVFQTWDTAVVDESLPPGGVLTASDVGGLASSMANNPALFGSAWAHAGSWWSVELPHGKDVTIQVSAQNSAELAPGVAVWGIGDAAPFDGGTTSWMLETSAAAFGTPHSFNAYGALGDAGTLWMQDGQGGNAKELLGYATSGPSYLGTTGWGETITTGVHDTTLTNDFTDSVTGATGAGFADLDLENVQGGWYLIYAGGTDHTLSGGLFDLTLSAVPEPSVSVSLGVGLLALFASPRARRVYVGSTPRA